VTRRTYDQYCPVAGALDLVGERWTLLIVRELMRGPARFTDLRASLDGVPPNLLAGRLRELEAEGLVARRELPPPAARTVYELTQDGWALEPVLRALVHWGMARMPPPDEVEIDPGGAVRSTLWAYSRPKAAGVSGRTWSVIVDDEPFTLQLKNGRIACRLGAPEHADLTVTVGAADLFRYRQSQVRPLLRYDPEDPALIAEFEAVFNLAEPTLAGAAPRA
jgi:DNA-binding HxlR family transcriptional regulator